MAKVRLEETLAADGDPMFLHGKIVVITTECLPSLDFPDDVSLCSLSFGVWRKLCFLLLTARDFGAVQATLFLGLPCGERIRRNDVTKRPVILCVDDEWNGLEGRRMLFEGRGYKVLVAASGEEALQLFASHPTDLVLLDYHMPKENGDIIAERMKASQPDVPIAMLSADEELPKSALESVDVFISKSESPTNLLEMVEHLLDLRFLFTPLDDISGGRQRYTA
jgi:CheY-like chemotaxis protein